MNKDGEQEIGEDGSKSPIVIKKDLRALSPEMRKVELLNMTLINYLQQVFTQDTDDYILWNMKDTVNNANLIL
jgi:hypothetical protein